MDIRDILVAVDGSPPAGKALDFACTLAKATGANLSLIHVYPDRGRGVVPEDLKALAEIEHVQITEREMYEAVANEIVENAARSVEEHGLPRPKKIVIAGNPARRIIEQAKSGGVDLIVLGSRGLGSVQEAILGSVSHKVSNNAPCACLIVR